MIDLEKETPDRSWIAILFVYIVSVFISISAYRHFNSCPTEINNNALDHDQPVAGQLFLSMCPLLNTLTGNVLWVVIGVSHLNNSETLYNIFNAKKSEN